MRGIGFAFAFVLFLLLIALTIKMSLNQKQTKAYHVKSINGTSLVITGKGDSPIWSLAQILDDFHYPWENEPPPKTRFQALHNNDWLYLLYQSDDNNINVYVVNNKKSEVGESDRVEIFFRSDEKMSLYYGIEIDPRARVMDYQAKYHRHFDKSWSWPTGHLIAKSDITPDGYTVEVAISKESLRQLGLIKDNQIEAGVFRGNCTELTGGQGTLKWISWLTPDSITPDFHIPSAFGLLVLGT